MKELLASKKIIRLDSKQWILIILPLILTAVMYLVFRWFNYFFVPPLGYLLSFIIYWLLWCFIFPLFMLNGIKGIKDLFKPLWNKKITKKWLLIIIILLIWPIALPLFFRFIPQISNASCLIITLSFLIGCINGAAEEILWRGTFLKIFPNNIWLNLFYSSFGFAIWHIAPQALTPNTSPGGIWSFLFFSFILGLTWSFITIKTQSIFWSMISHIIFDSLGLGAFAYIVWLR